MSRRLAHCPLLTNAFLEDREEESKVPFTLSSQVLKLLREPGWILPPTQVWVFWGEPYQMIFDRIGRCLRYRRTKVNNTGAGRTMRVYEGHKHSLDDFLNLEEDEISFVHEAHRLRGSKSQGFFQGFVRLFTARYPRNQIVFMSPGHFGKEMPGVVEHVKVIDGEVDVGWYWPEEGE